MEDQSTGEAAPSVAAAAADVDPAVARFAAHRATCTFCPHEGAAPDELVGWRRWRSLVHVFFDDTLSPAARAWGIFSMLLVAAATLVFCLETVPGWEDVAAWHWIEFSTAVFFMLEYVARSVCVSNVLRWAISPLNVIDLLSFLPILIELVANSTTTSLLSILRVVRLVRTFRILKFARYSAYMQIIGTAMFKSRDAFGLLLFFIVLAVVLFSSFMYYAEHDANEKFDSIPTTFYWCIVTMTTVGYGDIVPVTPLGKFIAGVTMICGILVIALPVTVLGNNFADTYEQRARRGQLRRLRKSGELGRRLAEHAAAVRVEREALEDTLAQLRRAMARRAAAHGTVGGVEHAWTALEAGVAGGLARVEHFLLELPQDFALSRASTIRSFRMSSFEAEPAATRTGSATVELATLHRPMASASEPTQA